MKNSLLRKKHNRILVFAIVLVAILFLLELNGGILSYAQRAGNAIKIALFTLKDSTDSAIDRHFSQASEIERLQRIEIENEHNKILLLALQDNIDNLINLLGVNKTPSLPSVALMRAYSYVNMGQYSRVLLDSDNRQFSDEERIYGLVRDNYTAGIALVKSGNLLGILNTDPKVSYGVYVGQSKSIGIFRNGLNGDAVIEYINAWSEINEGDEVITNGLDGIFFEGIKVGKVRKVRQEYGYIVAEVDLYNKNNDIGYLWLVDTGIPPPTLPR